MTLPMRNHQWSHSLPENEEPARAIVVLIGWWGATPRQMEKYAVIYENMQCATLTGVADSRAVAWKDNSVLREYARKGLIEVARLLEVNNKLPVFVHIFSNGGGFVWEQMEYLLEGADDNICLHPRRSTKIVDTEKTPLHSNTNLSLVRKNLRGQILDSCPAYPTIKTFMAALELSQASKKSFILFVIFKLFMLLLFTLETTWGFVRRKDNRVLVYWNQMLNSDFCQDQAFIFSTADTVTDPSHLQEFIATRQRKADSNISVLKLEDSAHVQHLRKHPNFYTHFVNTFVSELLEQPII